MSKSPSTLFVAPSLPCLSRSKTATNAACIRRASFLNQRQSASSPFINAPTRRTRTSIASSLSASSSTAGSSSSSSADSLGLTPNLRKYVDLFAAVPDPKLRYQQLLFFAKELPAMDASLKTDSNRVYGCTSLVHVHVELTKPDNRIQIQGDSDSQLTKGLLALLVNGLSGCDAKEIALINPEFITYSGLAASLTPSRNNGFVSMIAKIKEQVNGLLNETTAQDEAVGDTNIDESKPMYNALLRKLSSLKPAKLEIVDNSAQHAGHAQNIGRGTESHFAVSIVADAFEGLNLVKRHRLIYTLMNEEMSSGMIHALQIDARTPSEQ